MLKLLTFELCKYFVGKSKDDAMKEYIAKVDSLVASIGLN